MMAEYDSQRNRRRAGPATCEGEGQASGYKVIWAPTVAASRRGSIVPVCDAPATSPAASFGPFCPVARYPGPRPSILRGVNAHTKRGEPEACDHPPALVVVESTVEGFRIRCRKCRAVGPGRGNAADAWLALKRLDLERRLRGLRR